MAARDNLLLNSLSRLIPGLHFFIEYHDTGNQLDIVQKMCSKLPKNLLKSTRQCVVSILVYEYLYLQYSSVVQVKLKLTDVCDISVLVKFEHIGVP